MIRLSSRIVIQALPVIPPCEVAVRARLEQQMQVNAMSCCKWPISPCIVQGQTKTFVFVDDPTVDYTGASQITFDIWNRSISGASLLSYSLTGGQILLPADNKFSLVIDNSVSLSLPAGRHYCEAWVTLSTGEPVPVGMGQFTVEDSRKYDA